jgi:hypothetical protein
MNIELLHGTLSVSPNPGLETFDPRLSDIASLVQEGNYEEAASQAELVITDDIFDIRIIGYFLYGYFLEQGIEGMPAIYQCLSGLLGGQLEALGPSKNREKHIQTALNWLTKQLLKKMKYEEDKNSSSYEAWISTVSSDRVQEALDAGEKLGLSLGLVLEDDAGSVLEGLKKVNEWLAAFQKLVYRAPDDELENRDVDGEDQTRGDSGQSPTAFMGLGAGLEGSFHLELLLKKLAAFDHLVSAEKFSSAALVADDINSQLANFDPKLYFPKLFSRFSQLFAAHINELTAFEEHRNSVEWQALQELYKVDLESFVNFDPDAISLGTSQGMPAYEQPDENGGGDEGSEGYPDEPDESGDEDGW